MPPLASPRTRSLCSYWMFPARYMGVGCAVQVRGRSRRSIRRLRRAIFWCLLVLTRNVLHVIRSVLVWSPHSAMWYDISVFSFTRAANALVLGLVPPWISTASTGDGWAQSIRLVQTVKNVSG